MALTAARREGRVLVVELTRPEAGNALSRGLQRELCQRWRELEDDDELLLAILHGSGSVFSIGHDVEELARGRGPEASPIPEDGLFPLHLRKPVIAAVEGPCYGLGFELALSCDLRVAGAGARFGFPDRNLLVPYRVAAVLLPRLTFLGEGLDLLLSGKTVGAEGVRAARLLHRIAPDGRALATAVGLAWTMAERFGDAEAFGKRRIWGFSGLPLPYAMEVARGSNFSARQAVS